MPPRKTSGQRPRRKPEPEAPPAAAESPLRPGFAPECLMCPFGLFFFTLRQTRPEALEHMLRAGHELFLAFKAVMDQVAERWDEAESLQRITVR